MFFVGHFFFLNFFTLLTLDCLSFLLLFLVFLRYILRSFVEAMINLWFFFSLLSHLCRGKGEKLCEN